MTHSYVWLNESWHIWMTHSYVWLNEWWHISMSHSYVWHLHVWLDMTHYQSHIWMTRSYAWHLYVHMNVTHMNAMTVPWLNVSHTYECFIHMCDWMSHGKYEWLFHMCDSIWVIISHTYEQVTYEWVMVHINESWHIWMSHGTYEWVMALDMTHYQSHTWMSHIKSHIWMSKWAIHMCHDSFSHTYERVLPMCHDSFSHIYVKSSHTYWLISSHGHIDMSYGVATISRLLKMIGFFCKRALQKSPIFCTICHMESICHMEWLRLVGSLKL